MRTLKYIGDENTYLYKPVARLDEGVVSQTKRLDSFLVDLNS